MNLAERLAALMAAAEFSGAPPAARATLAAAMSVERFAAGATIVAEGERADRLYVLAEGEIEVTQAALPGRTQRLKRGALIGELAFFGDHLRTATLRAASPCALLSLPYPNFRAFLIAHPESALRLAERLAAKLGATEAELARWRQSSPR